MANPAYDMQFDQWKGRFDANMPGANGYTVVPSDTVGISDSGGPRHYAKKLYIGVTGDVNVIFADDRSNNGLGTAVLFKAHPVGYLDARVRAVLATGTTATNIVALTS